MMGNLENYQQCIADGKDSQDSFKQICKDLKISSKNSKSFQSFLNNCCIRNKSVDMYAEKILPLYVIKGMTGKFIGNLVKNEQLVKADKSLSPTLKNKLKADRKLMDEQADQLSRIKEDGKCDVAFSIPDCGQNAIFLANVSEAMGEGKIASMFSLNFTIPPTEQSLLKNHHACSLGTLDDGRAFTMETFAPNNDTLLNSPNATS